MVQCKAGVYVVNNWNSTRILVEKSDYTLYIYKTHYFLVEKSTYTLYI